jgi:teichoic acid glycerol-phosphate primase
MTESSQWASAGLIYGPAPHYIDHLAPLCHLLNIPLFVTEEEEESLLKKFYPEVQTKRINSIPLPEFLVENIDIVFLCTPRILFDEIFFFSQKLRNKKVHTIWVPHGNSDKGHLSLFMEGLDKEEIALVYGEKMIDFLKQKKAFNQLKKHVVIGNFRKAYYHKRKAFYDQMVQDKILRKLPTAEKTVLYAPTWKDSESSSSFLEATSFLVETLPPNWNLLIKPHPNLLMEDEERVGALIEKYETKDSVTFILDFPPIFPLLAITDIYIGDFSSIGYDFLGFDKPMFFLNQKKRDAKTDLGLYLYQCGIEVRPEDYARIYDIIKESLSKDTRLFSHIRKKVDEYTFNPRKSEELLKKEIEDCYSLFPDKDLNFY